VSDFGIVSAVKPCG